MSRPAVTVGRRQTVIAAARLLARHGIKRLPVVECDDRLIGIVTRADLLSVFLRTDEEIRDVVLHEVVRRNLSEDPWNVAVHEGVVTLRGKVELDTLVPIAGALAAGIDGVVDVVNELGYVRDAAHR